MKYRNLGAWLLVTAASAFAHPMGNFSVSHYAGFKLDGRGADIRYVLDLAEIPTFQLLQQWKLDAQSPREEIERRAAQQAREWTANLVLHTGAAVVTPRFERAEVSMDKGAGGMPVLRISADLRVDMSPGTLRYEDANYPDRAGWKEVVIVAGSDATIDQASPALADRSSGLTKYPEDPLTSPPQDFRAEMSWHSIAQLAPKETSTPAVPVSPAAPPPAPP